MGSQVQSNLESRARRAVAVFFSLFAFGSYALVAYGQNTIYTVAGGGSWSGVATGPTADLPAPGAVAADSAGNVYVADPTAHSVFKIDASHNLTVVAGIGYPTEHIQTQNGHPANQASLNAPAGVAIDKAGNVYIADTVNYLIRKVALNGLISAIAGNARLCRDPTSLCGDGGSAKLGQLNYPIGVTADGAGNVYIADTGDNRIRVVNVGTTTITVAGVSIAAGAIQTIAGTGAQCTNPLAGSCGDTGAAISAQLNNPQGVAVDSQGNIYISDSGDHRVRFVNGNTGVISPYAGSGNPCNPNIGCGDNGAATAAHLSNPMQISLDASGNLFIADPPENRIREVVANTQVITTVAGTGVSGFTGDSGLATAAELNGTRGVTVDTLGNVSIADTGNQRLRQFTVGGNINTLAGGGSGDDGSVATSAILGGSRGVVLDSAGNLYIADTYSNRIREVTPSNPPATYGTITTIVGTGIAGFYGNGKPSLSAQLSFPSGVALDSSNKLYIADTGNFMIRRYDPSNGLIVNVAGTPKQACIAFPCGDGGPALQAKFGRPTSVAVDSAGIVYVADADIHSIRVVNPGSTSIMVAGVRIPAGAIQTVAGNGTACTNSAIGQCGDGGPSTSAQLNTPFGVAVDGSGNIFIADTGDNRIRKVDAAGTITAYAYKGTSSFGPYVGPALNASFSSPHQLAVDPRGNLYVSGSDHFFVIERINSVNQHVIPVAGVPTDPKFYGFDGDGGLALVAHVNSAGVAIDGAGHLYIADAGNNRVREILLTPAASPSVSTLNFPTEPVHTTSPAQNFALINGGSDDLYLTSTSVSGPFALRSTTCASNVVPPGARCTFNLTFTPVAVGPVSGSITINDNAFGSPSQTVTLNGTGQ